MAIILNSKLIAISYIYIIGSIGLQISVSRTSTIFTSHTLVMRMSRKHSEHASLWALSIGVATVANKKALFITLVDRIPLDLTHTEASFSPNSIDSLCLRVA